MKIHTSICVRNGAGCWKWLPVDAEIVDIAPHLAGVATFVVCHAYGYGEFLPDWQIVNLETGAKVSPTWARTQAKSIERGRAVLANKTLADIERAYLATEKPT